jgi:hypothetical protein
MSALYMDSSSLANSSTDEMSDAYVYSAFWWRRYLLALYVCALRHLLGSMDSTASKQNRFCRSGYLYLIVVCLRDSLRSNL